jgi:hypothetical protein
MPLDHLELLKLSLRLVGPPLGVPARAPLPLPPFLFLPGLLLSLQMFCTLLLEVFR